MKTLQTDGKKPERCPKCGSDLEFDGDEKDGYRYFWLICPECGFQTEPDSMKVSEDENLEDE